MRRYSQHLAGLVLAVALGSTTTAAHSVVEARTLAAPEIIIVHGSLLPEQRVLASFQENHRLLLSVNRPAPFPSTPLAKRPALQLALFWGVGWRTTAESPERLRALRPGQATQRGTFYPATGTAPALLMVGQTAGMVSDSGLAILRRHGVPVRVP
jgi:hypothetical protein